MLIIDLHRDRPARVQEPGSGDLPGLEYFQSESEYLKPINGQFKTMNYRTFIHRVTAHINAITNMTITFLQQLGCFGQAMQK